MRKPHLIATAFALTVALAACAGGTSDEAEAVDDESSTVETEVPDPTTTTTVQAYEPEPSDFGLSVVILEKTCFGTAGCNVTYQVELAYSGLEPLDSNVTYTLVYEVYGGEDGAQVNNLEITGDEYLVDPEERISTASSSVELTADVIAVRPG